jgi:release factor glutamine methyltransferase
MHEAAERIRFFEGDLLQPLEELDLRAQVDVITANPPYIQSRDLLSLQPEVRDHEPEMALIAGPEGTEFHQRIIREAPQFLKRGGALVMEMGIGQAEKLAGMAEEIGAYTRPKILKDLAGIDRVIVAKMKKLRSKLKNAITLFFLFAFYSLIIP